MNKKIIVILIVLFMVSISGCTFKTTADKTWGEKEPAKSSDLYVVNSTGDHYERNGTMYYYAWGYVGNKAQKSASNVEITVKFFSENGTLVGTNKTSPYRPKSIPSEGQSYFYAGFKDPDQKITKYEIELAIKD